MAFVAATSLTGLSNSPSVPVPSGAQAGDDVVLVCTRDAPAENYATTKPSGFSTLDIASLTGDGQQIFVGHKKLTAGDTGSYTFGTQPDSWYWVCQAFLFRGRLAPDPIPADGITVAELNSPASSPVSMIASGVTASAGDDLLWLGAPDTTSGTTGVFAPPGGFVERTDAHADLWANLSGATKDAVTAGATGDVTGVFTASGVQSGYAAYLIRLRQAGGGASVADVDAAVDSVSAVSGSPDAVVDVPGAVDGVSTVSAAPDEVAAVSGSADGVSTVSAAPDQVADIAGAADGSSAVSAAPDQVVDVPGAVDGVSTVSAAPDEVAAVSGSADGVSTVSAAPDQVADEAASIDGVSAVSGSPEAGTAAADDVAAAIDAVSGVSAAPDQVAAVSGSADGSSAVSGSPGEVADAAAPIAGSSFVSADGELVTEVGASIDGVSVVWGGVVYGSAGAIAGALMAVEIDISDPLAAEVEIVDWLQAVEVTIE